MTYLLTCLLAMLQDSDGRSLAADNDGLCSTGGEVRSEFRLAGLLVWNLVRHPIFHHLLHSMFFSGQSMS